MNKLLHGFGNVFSVGEWKHPTIATSVLDKFKYICEKKKGEILTLSGSNLITVPKRELKIILGITPTCLAEMARGKGGEIEIHFFRDRVETTVWEYRNEMKTAQRSDESLEEFCLRVAIDRNYLNLSNE